MMLNVEVVASLVIAHVNGVDKDKIRRLPAYKKLKSMHSHKNFHSNPEIQSASMNKRSNKTENKAWKFMYVVIGVTLYTMHHYQLHTNAGFSKFWLEWENLPLHVEKCTIDAPSLYADVFRPPVDCAMCRGVRQVDERRVLSPEEFERTYAYSGRPVLVLDGQRNWSTPETFTFEFFAGIYAPDSPVIMGQAKKDCQFFPYKTEFQGLGEVFGMSEERKQQPWYIGWSNCDSTAAVTLRNHYGRPYFLPPTAESSKVDWIFLGTPGHGAHMHIDHVGKPSWQAQIRGRKVWSLEPPPECYMECGALEVEVWPGNIVVLDTNIWFHKTSIVSDDISITIGSEYD